MITGAGPTAGAALVAHPKVRMISMTGSSETGKRVMRDSAATLKRLTLELGGKNAQIVLPDADLDRAAQGIMLGAFLNQARYARRVRASSRTEVSVRRSRRR